MTGFENRVDPTDSNKTRAGHLLTIPLDVPLPVVNHRIRPLQPRYVLGWTFTRDELKSLTGIGHFVNASLKVRNDWYAKWHKSSANKKHRIGGFLDPTHHITRLTIHISSNNTEEERALADDKEFLNEAKNIIGRSDDPKWLHFDRF